MQFEPVSGVDQAVQMANSHNVLMGEGIALPLSLQGENSHALTKIVEPIFEHRFVLWLFACRAG